MAERPPLVLDDNMKIQRLQAGDTLPGGSGLPTPDEPGQVLFAVTSAAFTKAVPMLGPYGWMMGGGRLLVK